MVSSIAPSTQPKAQLAYCTNVHPGESLERSLAMLDRYATQVRDHINPRGTLGLGLWLSAASAREILRTPDGIAQLRDWFNTRNFEVITLNGFPYGDFHQAVVKTRVYKPNWTAQERLAYSISLAEILAGLLPTRASTGSISTLPIGWRADFSTDEQAVGAESAAQNLRSLAAQLSRIEASTGKRITVDLEPEPGCLLDTAPLICRFFEQHLASAESRRYLGVCHDTCHSAVMFEPQADAFACYEGHGVRVGKVQVSSALACNGAAKELAELAQFAEGRYLHQTSVLVGSGTPRFFDDLDAALDENLDGLWRTHFHVPVFLEELGRLSTTSHEIAVALASCSKIDPPIFEVETYAWSVLPPHLREGDLAHGIAKELLWTRAALKHAGFEVH